MNNRVSVSINYKTKGLVRMFFLGLFLSSLVHYSAFTSTAAADSSIKEWTVMHYASGRNNLDDLIAHDINEIEAIGSTDQVNFITQWASIRNQQVVRIKLERDLDFSKVRSPIVQTLDYQKTDMGDWRQVVQFARWAMAHYPAKRYFLIIGGHGKGWQGKSLAPDSVTSNAITANQLSLISTAVAYSAHQPLDIFGMDACLMSMVEIAGEVQGSTRIMIGSQRLEPGEGWSYTTFARLLREFPQADTAKVAQMAIDTYHDSFGHNDAVTLSALDLQQLPRIAYVLRQLTPRLPQDPAQAASLRAFAIASAGMGNVFKDMDLGYTDLGVFVEELNKKFPLDAPWMNAFRSEYKKLVLSSPGKYTGASIWIPSSKSSYDLKRVPYRNLRFIRASEWNLFLDWLFPSAPKTP